MLPHRLTSPLKTAPFAPKMSSRPPRRTGTSCKIGFVFSNYIIALAPVEIGFVFSTRTPFQPRPHKWVRFFKSVSQNPGTPQFWLRVAETPRSFSVPKRSLAKPIPQFKTSRFFFSLRFNSLPKQSHIVRTAIMRFSYQKSRSECFVTSEPHHPTPRHPRPKFASAHHRLLFASASQKTPFLLPRPPTKIQLFAPSKPTGKNSFLPSPRNPDISRFSAAY